MTDIDIEVFYGTDASGISQAHTSADMGFEEKTPDLLVVLIAHAEGSTPTVVVVPQPPTLAATHMSSANARDKKRKKAQEGKSAEGIEEGEITQSPYQPPTKEVQTGKRTVKEVHIHYDF